MKVTKIRPDIEDPSEPPEGPVGDFILIQIIDEEVKKIVDGCYDTATSKLIENKDKLDLLAAKLIKKETLDEIEKFLNDGYVVFKNIVPQDLFDNFNHEIDSIVGSEISFQDLLD